VGIEDHFGRDARIATADDHDIRPLAAGGKPFVSAALQRQPGFDEGAIAF
jgi:hypothetical protein